MNEDKSSHSLPVEWVFNGVYVLITEFFETRLLHKLRMKAQHFSLKLHGEAAGSQKQEKIKLKKNKTEDRKTYDKRPRLL